MDIVQLGKTIAEQGVIGVLLVAACIVIYFLARHIVRLYDRIYDIQEVRRKENEAIQKELSTTLQTFSQSANLLIGKIDLVKKDET